MSIRINATVNEARAAAGHNREQWDRFYVSRRASRRGGIELTGRVHYKGRGKAALRSTPRMDQMDPDPRQREGADVGAHK